jgi:hypothetical protein
MFKRSCLFLAAASLAPGCGQKKERCLNALKYLTESTSDYASTKKNEQAERFCC